MKLNAYKKFSLLSALLLTAGILMSCGQKNSAEDYIGIDAAKEKALAAADIASGDAVFSSAGLDKKNNIFYYQVVFTADGREYQYAIDAVTGVVIEEKQSEAAQADSLNSQEEGASVHQEAAAKPAAEGTPAQAGDSGSQTEETPTAQPSAQALPETTSAAGQPGSTGTAGTETKTAAASGSPDSASALQIALSHAGLTSEDVYAIEIDSDWENGRMIYEIEFISQDGTEYEYDIDATDGTILKFDQDTASSLAQTGSAVSSGIISKEQAKQAVLSRVPGASESKLCLLYTSSKASKREASTLSSPPTSTSSDWHLAAPVTN